MRRRNLHPGVGATTMCGTYSFSENINTVCKSLQPGFRHTSCWGTLAIKSPEIVRFQDFFFHIRSEEGSVSIIGVEIAHN